MMEVEEQKGSNEIAGCREKEIIDEIDVVYVPFKAPIHVVQYPLQERVNEEFEKYLMISHCEYRAQQKRLDINYKLRGSIENYSVEDNQMRQGMDMTNNPNENEDENDDEDDHVRRQNRNVAVTYTSKLVSNQTNYFATKYDPISKQLMCYAVDSFLQMRPKLQEKDISREKDAIQKNIAKLSKEKERDEQLRKKHPQKYIEMKLKNFNSFKEIYDSEEPIRLNYHNCIDPIMDKRFRCFTEPPRERISLTPVTKSEFQENLESGGQHFN